MMSNKNKATSVVAVLVVVLLGILGINRIGGETWISAAASGQPGWRAGAGLVTPPAVPVLRLFLVPILMVAALLVVAALGAILNRYSGGDDGAASADAAPGLHSPRD